MATVNIGSLKFNWKGAYNGSTAYAIDDVTEYNGSSYICILASTGNLPTNTTYFQPMATKGTDGTDVGTTLTTQGDILYRDGSGLQRLAAGTNGQVLQTGGSGANPSWGTVSSDYVKISNGTFSNVGSLDLDGSTYWGNENDYIMHKLVLYDFVPQSSSNVNIQQIASGTVDTNNRYSYAIAQRNSSGTTVSAVGGDVVNSMRFTQDNMRGGMGHGIDFVIHSMLTSDNDHSLQITSVSTGVNQDGVLRNLLHMAGGSTEAGNAMNSARTGLRIIMSTGNMSGKYVTYGIKG